MALHENPPQSQPTHPDDPSHSDDPLQPDDSLQSGGPVYSDAGAAHGTPVRVAQLNPDDARSAADGLTALSTRELRVLCNQTYRALDTDQPSFETVYLYEALCEAWEAREALDAPAARAVRVEPVGLRGSRAEPMEHFRDNRWSNAFELIRDGVVTGSMKYLFRGGDVALLHLAVDPRCDDFEVEASLVRHVLLELHRRRLSATSFCPEVGAFIADHPGFQSLLPLRHRYHDSQNALINQRGMRPGLLDA